MGRISLAIRSFFSILFSGSLPEDGLTKLGLTRRGAPKAQTASTAVGPRPSDGALQMLSILQRDARLVDFIMEDIVAYTDDQVGAAVRGLHDQARESLARYVKLEPVIDGVEGTFTKPALSEFRRASRRAACCAIRAGAPAKSIFRRSILNRIRASSLRLKLKWNEVRHRNRPGHDQLRPGLRRNQT